MVKLEDGKPVSVWTGGTNISDGGIFGHSNVAHVIENNRVAKTYLKYWNAWEVTDVPDLQGEVEVITEIPSKCFLPEGYRQYSVRKKP